MTPNEILLILILVISVIFLIIALFIIQKLKEFQNVVEIYSKK